MAELGLALFRAKAATTSAGSGTDTLLDRDADPRVLLRSLDHPDDNDDNDNGRYHLLGYPCPSPARAVACIRSFVRVTRVHV
ncbi:hypothetical protein MN608_11825 [Microdochium nivale]|nr:hypothetical protein MN608_11825 [Microdochium nivale]